VGWPWRSSRYGSSGPHRQLGSTTRLSRDLLRTPCRFERAITLRHLLTMRSGIAFDNDDFSLEMLVGRPGDPVRHILAKPLYDDPGARFDYRDADPQLLSSAVERETGRTLERLAREHLFGPLGITDYFWEADPAGTTLGPYALFLRPRDMAKIGQLVLQGGTWNGTQVVPSEWIRLSTSAQSSTNRGVHLSYGYYWWVLPELDAFTASGHGGNFIFVAPKEELVVVMTSLPHASDEVGTTLERFLPLARGIRTAIR
jgi:CubicO group peptidase (beta-lactamase class C family)